jgi:ABC-type Zn uptake system ZnuABC Zn-binding protein ZnuA
VKGWLIAVLFYLTLPLSVGCAGGSAGDPEAEASEPLATLALPAVAAAGLDDSKLRVLATTSIIGDVVSRVGGEAITLTTLMKPGQDPHSYQPGAADLTAAADADLIFVNGWGLEEALVDDLATIGRGAAIIPVSAGIEPVALGGVAGGPEVTRGTADPHTWQDAANVLRWVENIRATLSAADPANAATYDANASAYRATLEQLDGDLRATLAEIPANRRVLVTNHDNLGYFAAAYDFEVLGAIIPSVSTLAEPTAGGLAELAHIMGESGVCALFIETTAGEQLARALAQELSGCQEVRVLTLYTDALGPPGSGADSYTGMMRANASALVEGLR